MAKSEYLSTAPSNVLDGIFVYCDYAEPFASSHVCTAWRKRTCTSVLWRRVAQRDLERARGTEYQVVATPVEKRAGLSSSFNTAHLYQVEVRTRHRPRDATPARGGYGRESSAYGHSTSSLYAADGRRYYSSSSSYSFSVGPSYGGGWGGEGELERNPSSTCFAVQGSTAAVRRVSLRYLHPLRFTAGERAAALLQRANAPRIPVASASSPSSFLVGGFDDTEARERSLALWEDGSLVRPGVLLCDRADPGSFCYYAATLHRPWCTVLMDDFIVDDRLLVDPSMSSSRGGAAASIDLAFRVEAVAVVRNDRRDPTPTVTPSQPVGIRIGVVEASQLAAYQRGLQDVLHAMTFYSPTDAAAEDEDAAAPTHRTESSERAEDYVWGPLGGSGGPHHYSTRTGGSEVGGGVSWTYTGGGGGARAHGHEEEMDAAAAAEAEVAAWLQASVEASMTATERTSGTGSQSLAFWDQTSERRPTRGHSAADHPHAFARNNSGSRYGGTTGMGGAQQGGSAFVLGDTPGSFGYDSEGSYISDASCYPLGPALLNGDVVHLLFLHDEDVIVVMRNMERLGTLVADAFSEGQRWCVAVSLQNCGVRFIPPKLE